jgi:hypothetical protein
MTRLRAGWPVVLLLAGCGSTAAPKSPGIAETDGRADGGAVASASPVSSPASADAGDEAEAGAAGERSREDRRVGKMMAHVSTARKLAGLKPVPGVVLARDALIAKVKAHVEREVPPDAIQHEGLELQLLGFVPASFDYLAETFVLLTAQLAGFYEPSDGTMYMAADLDEQNAEATLAHELDHALQDQHFDLKPHSKFEAGKSDEQGAFDALAEGDATSTMADVLLGKAMPGKTALDLPEEVFARDVIESVSTGATADVPHLMRTSLVAPYVYGTLFVNALRRGGGWSAVDAAWTTLPTTTEQILHVEKWRAHEPALDVATPTFAALGTGWTAVDVDTNGELGLRLAFEEWMGAERAKTAADGWGGDRGALVQNGEQSALVIHVRYDAKRAGGANEDPFALVAAGLAASVGKPKAKDAAWACIERPQLGPLAVMRKERELVLVAGPARSGASSKAWAKAGDCALAKRWAGEVAAEK